MGAGTGAEISVKIRGACDTLSATLSSSTTGLTPFLYGQTDEFHVTGDHVGPLFDVTVWHDGSGYYSAWHLERVEVDESPGVTVEFPCNCWVYGNTPITLKPQVPQGTIGCLRTTTLGTSPPQSPESATHNPRNQPPTIREASPPQSTKLAPHNPRGQPSKIHRANPHCTVPVMALALASSVCICLASLTALLTALLTVRPRRAPRITPHLLTTYSPPTH
uniref:Uncharacterized protein LOC116956649 n=1 Tax=Petromyzon marinus TaxID=7757 RepID=A0AAJ7UD84_PETMA|nr:uncharacterized protein LOC116956649 [Petromyzon marinus]